MVAVAHRPRRARWDSWLRRASPEKAAAPSLQDVAGAPRPPRSRSEARGEGQEPRRSQAYGRVKVRTPSPVGLQCKLCRRPQEKWGAHGRKPGVALFGQGRHEARRLAQKKIDCYTHFLPCISTIF